MHTKPVIGILTAALAASTAANAQAPVATPMVETQNGAVQGLEDDGIDAFLGLRYAAPPTGENRFMPPQPAANWRGTYDATSMGAPCMQMYTPSGPNETAVTRQLQGIFPTYGEAKIDNEDCLFLNVWTPEAGSGSRPVMVWFHGGGYDYGSGNWPAYNGRNLAEKGDVVVVTVNHRLNAFGYLDLSGYDGDYAASGNVGNLDLVAALEWVRDNIAGFGGDPANVTIMGESGGGSKVSHLLAMPAAAGLFDKAVIQSGPGVTGGKQDEARELAGGLLEAAGVETVEELRALPAEAIITAARAALPPRGMGFARGPRFGPVVDGEVLPRDPFLPRAPEVSQDVPILIGYNKDEATLFTAPQPWFGTLTNAQLDAMTVAMGEEAAQLVAYYREQNPDDAPSYIASAAMGSFFSRGTYVLADQKSRAGGAPVYVYRLTWETPVADGLLRSPHTLEIPLMFDNAAESAALVGTGPETERMAEMLSDAWIAFAKTGTPSSPLLPEWQPYSVDSRVVMQLDIEPELVDDPEAGLRAIGAGG